jgi:hypothetical protein
MLEPIFIKPETISKAYFISHQSVYPHARQRLSRYIPVAMNTHNNRITAGGTVFYTFRRIEGEFVGLSVNYAIVARQRIRKHVPVATKNFWRRRFLCGLSRVKGTQAITSY